MNTTNHDSGNWTEMTQNIVKADILYENITEEQLPLPFHPITFFVERYTVPVICTLGLISNTLSSVVFSQKPLKNNSCSIYLAARGMADNGFLSTLLIIWISQAFNLKLGSISGFCKIMIFLSYFCGFISVWLVVCVTFENYIRICKLFLVNRICTKTIAKKVFVILCITSVCLYNFPFWAMSSNECVPYPQYYKTVQVFIYADTVITLALPLCCIVYLMTAIVSSLIKSYNIRNARTKVGKEKTEHTLAKVTKMLFAVTVTFFCLNLPSHVYRYVIITEYVLGISENGKHSIQEEAIQHTTLLLSYISVSTNIVVYIVFGKQFRQVLVRMCFPCSSLKKRETRRENKFELGELCKNTEINELSSPVNKSITVMMTDKEWKSKLEPLERAYTC